MVFDPRDTRRAFRRYLERRYDQCHRAWRFVGSTAESLRQWQEEIRPRFLELLGLPEEPVRVPTLIERLTEEETVTYLRERLLYETIPELYVPALLLTPKPVTRPRPAVLCPPGHGRGMYQLVDEDGPYKKYPWGLVERGFVVLVPEHAGFGLRTSESGDDPQANHTYYYQALNLLGESAMGFLLFDLQRALDLLATLPQVDGERIGCWGVSLGGEMTLLTAAVDERIKVACISGFLSSYRSSFLDCSHCGCGYVFGLARYLEHVDIASLIVPRPLLVESPSHDIFPLEAANQAVAELRRLYALWGVPERLDQDIFEAGHEISGAKAFDWLERWL